MDAEMAPPLAKTKTRTPAGTIATFTLVATAILAAMGSLSLFRGKPLLGDDNDSMLRLVEVRDLLDGQNWFDLTQYRLGLEGGVEMHWSRLIDAPLAGLVLLARLFGFGDGAAETFAMAAWPILLALPALYAIIRAARGLSGDDAMLPAAAIGVAALFYTGQFAPGSIDHHSAQAALALVTIMAMTAADLSWRNGALAGGAAALMAGIGAETHPHVALCAVGAAAIFLFEGYRQRGFTIGFGSAFSTILAAIFLGTIEPAHYLRATCDAISIAQVAPGVAGGLALAAVGLIARPEGTLLSRLVILAGTGGLALLIGGPFAVSCLGDPLADINGLVRTHWLDLVEEARPLLAIGRDNPSLGLSYGLPPLIGLAWIVRQIRRGQPLRQHLVMGGAVAVSYAIALIQVRGGVLAMLLATIPLASFVAAARTRAMSNPTVRNQFAMAGAWLSSMALVWGVVGLMADPATWAALSDDTEVGAT
ncbi:MAG: hypothetical protein IPL47_02710 [Phyllobacteriaceae bacterium]|nr:hypothetical protein [Phyllobacteriaceae bacterium]